MNRSMIVRVKWFLYLLWWFLVMRHYYSEPWGPIVSIAFVIILLAVQELGTKD